MTGRRLGGATMGSPRILGLLVVVSLALHLGAEYYGPAWQAYVFKPLTTGLVLAGAAIWPSGLGTSYRARILAGLVCSLAGDVFLMAPGDWFVAGLASFLAAHVCYIGAFATTGGLRVTPRLAVPFALYAGAFLWMLWPAIGGLRAAVAVYAVVLSAMAWQATERWLAWRTGPAAGAALGGLLFLASDSVLAVNRFLVPFRASRLIVMSTYIAAQWLIARSVSDTTPDAPNR